MMKCLLIMSFFCNIHCLIQDWTFQKESRRQFLIERFAFDQGGKIQVQLELLPPTQSSKLTKGQYGVFLRHQSQMGDKLASFQEPDSMGSCLYSNDSNGFRIDLSDEKTWQLNAKIENTIVPGFYYFYYAQCGPRDSAPSFKMKATFMNKGPNYLPAGDQSLPSVYMLISLAFLGALIAWVVQLRSNPQQVQPIHHIMTVLVLFKFLSLFSEAMRYQYMKTRGDALTSWTTIFYIFAFIKGTMLFVVILLIGTGWSLIKPFLNEREKKTILLVLVLQVINNIAFVALSEASIGTLAWFHWRDIVHLVDIFCCCTILFPIVWSIRTLRQAAGTDGKAQANLQKLVQFRSFYLLVICYIYFTRIVVYLLAATLPFHYTWVQVFCSEGAALAFYVTTGYKFRPIVNNPYLPVHTKDHLDEFSQEFGLEEDDDIEMASRR